MLTRVDALLHQLRLFHAAAVLPEHLERAAQEELAYLENRQSERVYPLQGTKHGL